jgi:hypothetical protein
MALPGERDGFITATEEGTFGGPPPGSLGAMTPVTWTNFICRSRHPFAAFFHIAFKVRPVGPHICTACAHTHACGSFLSRHKDKAAGGAALPSPPMHLY